ncbi:MAG: Fibronectin type domain protein [Chitinophagaceae bacterium]|nr:Fibronectin type domain protein [Chitinophagaceae bacterium]
MSLKKLVVTVFLCVVGMLKATAQAPVQLSASVQGPYSTLLSEYYNDQARLSVALLNTSATETFLQVYLKMSIEGQGIKLQSAAFANYPSIDLTSGYSVILRQKDLAPYFNPRNLQGSTASGLSRLPEGDYQFCFEVYERNTGRLLSDKQCAQAYLTFSDQPFLTSPEKEKVISRNDPLSILFQWTPRHLSNPNASRTSYEFTLVEVKEGDAVPEATFNKSAPLYTTSVLAPSLYYGPDQPQLEVGKRYAWRVRASLVTTSGEQEPFRNDGYSEVFWFKMQQACPALSRADIFADHATNTTTLSWASDNKHVGATRLDYRKKGTGKWTTVEAAISEAVLSDLLWNTEYEYQLGNRCALTDEFAYGRLESFKTINQDLAHDVPKKFPKVSNHTLIDVLNAGDVVYVQSYVMRIIQVTGVAGRYSGEAYVGLLVPNMSTPVMIKATFQDLQVNIEKQIFSGKIEAKENGK